MVGLTYGHVTTRISWIDRKPNFLSYGAPLVDLCCYGNFLNCKGLQSTELH